MHYNNWYYCNVIVYMVNDVNPYVSISASIGCYFCNIPPLIVCLYSHPFLWLWYKCNTPYVCQFVPIPLVLFTGKQLDPLGNIG